MKFITNENPKDIWFLTDQMAYMLKQESINITDIIKLPEFENKLVTEDIIKVGHLQKQISQLFFKNCDYPFVTDKANPVFVTRYNEVINSLKSENLPDINKVFNRFYVKTVKDTLVIGLTQSDNENTFFKSDTAFEVLNSNTVEKALLEALYRKYMYTDLHFKPLVVAKSDELCLADILAVMGSTFQ